MEKRKVRHSRRQALQKGRRSDSARRLATRIPLFGKWFDETHHPELVEGEGLPARRTNTLAGNAHPRIGTLAGGGEIF
jgi:hypothetical protein